MFKTQRKTSEPIDFDILVTANKKEHILGSVKTIKKISDSQISYSIEINGLLIRKLIFENNNGNPGALLITKSLEK